MLGLDYSSILKAFAVLIGIVFMHVQTESEFKSSYSFKELLSPSPF